MIKGNRHRITVLRLWETKDLNYILHDLYECMNVPCMNVSYEGNNQTTQNAKIEYR